MEIVKENKFYLTEKLFKRIKKTQVGNKQLWQFGLDEINVYIFPDSKQEKEDAMLNDFETIRIGITEDGKLLFWNGDVLHSGVSNALGIGDFLVRLVKEKKNRYFTSSGTEMADIKQFKKYIMSDPAYEKGVETLKKMFPTATHMLIAGTKINL